jgi:secreted trypsin-like serine protease
MSHCCDLFFLQMMTHRIIGGIDAVDGRYSYAQISLQFDGSHVCGASLVSSDMVLTAAHCLDAFDTIVVNAYNVSQEKKCHKNKFLFTS